MTDYHSDSNNSSPLVIQAPPSFHFMLLFSQPHHCLVNDINVWPAPQCLLLPLCQSCLLSYVFLKFSTCVYTANCAKVATTLWSLAPGNWLPNSMFTVSTPSNLYMLRSYLSSPHFLGKKLLIYVFHRVWTPEYEINRITAVVSSELCAYPLHCTQMSWKGQFKYLCIVQLETFTWLVL